MSETKINETKPSGTKPSETKPKKMVRRSVAIALGIICIILIAGLAGAFVIFTTQVASLQNQVNGLTRIANLWESEVWLTNATYSMNPNDSVTLGAFHPSYSGYITIAIEVQPYVYPDFWIRVSWDMTYFSYADNYKVEHGLTYSERFYDYFVSAPIDAFHAGTGTIPTVYVDIGTSSTMPIQVTNATITYYY